MIKKYIRVFLIADVILSILAFSYGGFSWLINSQFAFVSSLLITLATFVSYKKSVLNRVESFDDTDMQNENARDKLDEIDDAHDLYSPDIKEGSQELSKEEIKTVLKEEKAKVKKNSLKNTIATAGSFMSIYRIGGYFLLAVGLLYLSNNKIFEIIPYLIGLFVVPLSMLLSKFILKEEAGQ